MQMLDISNYPTLLKFSNLPHFAKWVKKHLKTADGENLKWVTFAMQARSFSNSSLPLGKVIIRNVHNFRIILFIFSSPQIA